MCTRGVFQLKKLSLFFCDFGGSSTGVRQFLTSGNLKNFMQQNQQIEFNFICKRNNHPFVTGAYINGYLKDMPLRNEDELKVLQALSRLRNQLGRKSLTVSGPRVYHHIQSVQGKWEPNMFNSHPRAQYEKTHSIPRVKYNMIEKEVKDRRFLKKKDQANVLLRQENFGAGKHD